MREHISIKCEIIYLSLVILLFLTLKLIAFFLIQESFKNYTYVKTEEFIITDKYEKNGILDLYIEIYNNGARPKILAPETYLNKRIGDKVLIDIYEDNSVLRYKISEKETIDKND